jgi:putative nucleotidyltransferase with HDIG domain
VLHNRLIITRLYVGCVGLLGGAAIVHSAITLYPQPSWVWRQWFLLAALTLLSGSITIRIPSVGATISVSETFVFTSVLLFGAPAGTLIAALDGLIISLWLQRRDPSVKKIVFNTAAPGLSIWVAAVLFFGSAGVTPLAFNDVLISRILPSLVLLATAYFLLNSWLMAWAVALERHTAAVHIWRRDFLWVSLNFFGGASVAALLVALNRQVTLGAIAVIVPLLVISYLTFKTAVGRIEDATAHLTQLNKLYLSTIETLAMAIDAKDQITHGHIRRVQQYAIDLARVLGVDDDEQIRAIEAAALLHDMGKLAVPEYILNKPGKLTAAEFEKMKLHSSVGADILAAIDFPYPVVPIVRHHHENWNGTGYPAGLAGTAIPIGARILSVVDCFDALTSDRPYRPRLTDDEALDILRERRGTMYDPFIVDMFLTVYRQSTPQEFGAPQSDPALNEIARASIPVDVDAHGRFQDISSGADETLSLYELARALAGKTGLEESADLIEKYLRRLIPAQLCVFYIFEPERGELVARHATESLVSGLRIGLGERIAGWVAANRHSIVNSDPALDLGDFARGARPRLRSTLSTPIVSGERLIGVLSLYSPSESAFTENHKRIIEAVSLQIADTLAQSKSEDERSHPALTVFRSFPTFHSISQLTSVHSPIQSESLLPCSIIFIELRADRHLQISSVAAQIQHLTEAIRRHVRASDFVFSYSETQFVALLTQTDKPIAAGIAARIAASWHLDAPDGKTVDIRVGAATAPADGQTISELLSSARAHPLVDINSGSSGPTHIH